MSRATKKPWITHTEAAELAGVVPSRISQLGREGTIIRERMYGRWVYGRGSVLRWAKRPQKTGRPRISSR